jgi:hypothetical protein
VANKNQNFQYVNILIVALVVFVGISGIRKKHVVPTGLLGSFYVVVLQTFRP